MSVHWGSILAHVLMHAESDVPIYRHAAAVHESAELWLQCETALRKWLDGATHLRIFRRPRSIRGEASHASHGQPSGPRQ